MFDVCKWENNVVLFFGGRGVVYGLVKKYMWIVCKELLWWVIYIFVIIIIKIYFNYKISW